MKNSEKIPLVRSTFLDEDDTREKLCEFIMQKKKLSMGEECRKFEENFSKKQKRKHSCLVNSGSSANLILLQALLNMKKLKKGDKVLFSSLTWATNAMPIIQLGLTPIPLDIQTETLNANHKTFKETCEKYKNIKCLFLTNALGFCSDIDMIKKYCEENNIIFLEDNCESLGSVYQKELLGNFGLASTCSFYVGHQMSLIEGGIVTTDDDDLYENLLMARAHGWGRNNSEKFLSKYERDAFYDLYTFYVLGYNVRPTEIQGFIGNLQIKKWDFIVDKREKTFRAASKTIEENEDLISLDLKHMDKISSFGIPVISKDKKTAEKYKRTFTENNIEIRPIISGDLTSHPFFKTYTKEEYSLKNVKLVHENGFYIGNDPELNKDELDRIIDLLKN